MAFDSRFLRACRREPVDCTPVWMMRQAGRYLEEYRAVRARHSFLDMCRTPELAAEVTLQPLRRFDLDAAIIFADILLPLPGMGIDLAFVEGKGPVIGSRVRSARDVDNLHRLLPDEHVPFLADAIRLVRRELKDRVPLIGFSGAPFTLASYVLEGGSSRDFAATKTLMYDHPALWHRLLDKLSDGISAYLEYQIDAGVEVVQLFDSWVGTLGPADYQEYVLPYSSRVIEQVKGKVPLIHFGTNTTALLGLMKEAGGDVIGFDWRVDLGEAWASIGYDVGVQGNLDPVVLLASPQVIEDRVRAILAAVAGRPGHVFNLGHGILPTTPPEHASVMIDTVHRLSLSCRAA